MRLTLSRRVTLERLLRAADSGEIVVVLDDVQEALASAGLLADGRGAGRVMGSLCRAGLARWADDLEPRLWRLTLAGVVFARAMRPPRPNNARLTSAQVRRIRRRYARGGVSYPQLARRFHVGENQIGRIVRGDAW